MENKGSANYLFLYCRFAREFLGVASNSIRNHHLDWEVSLVLEAKTKNATQIP